MHPDLTRVLRQQGGVVRHGDIGPAWLITNAVRAGELVRAFPSTYVETDRTGLRRAAALRYASGRAAISHTTALDVWRVGWTEPTRAPLHLTVRPAVHVRGAPGLVIHRQLGFDPGQRVKRAGLLVTSLPATLADSWPLLPKADRIGLVIGAVTGGHVTIEALRRYFPLVPKLPGMAKLRRLLDLLAAGCQSPLELWGALHVFTGYGMPLFQRQYPIGGYRLDVYAEAERIAFELDGAAFHGSRVQRERDLRRDAALAAMGIQVVRFTYARLMSEPDTIRREVRKILASRRP